MMNCFRLKLLLVISLGRSARKHRGLDDGQQVVAFGIDRDEGSACAVRCSEPRTAPQTLIIQAPAHARDILEKSSDKPTPGVGEAGRF